MREDKRYCAKVPRAFTLLELLIILGIIATLFGLIAPATASARRVSRELQCQSNVRQLLQGFFAYAADHHGRYPSNLAFPTPQAWCDPDRLGRYVPLPPEKAAPDDNVYACPEDGDARRSYAMNVWASGAADATLASLPLKGIRWRQGVRRASQMVLLIEAWPYVTSGKNVYEAKAAIGASGSPGARFGAAGGITPIPTPRFGKLNTDVTFARHRRPNGAGKGVEPLGRTVIGFADGHVAIHENTELADPVTGVLTGTAYWSPLDFPFSH